jgi:hypothetical protein
VDVNTTIFITTVVALATTNLGALYFMVNRLGASIDGLGGRIDGLGGRIDGLDARIDRLDGRMDLLQSTVADMGARLTLIERRA